METPIEPEVITGEPMPNVNPDTITLEQVINSGMQNPQMIFDLLVNAVMLRELAKTEPAIEARYDAIQAEMSKDTEAFTPDMVMPDFVGVIKSAIAQTRTDTE